MRHGMDRQHLFLRLGRLSLIQSESQQSQSRTAERRPEACNLFDLACALQHTNLKGIMSSDNER